MTHERRILLLALASGAPALLTALLFVWLGDYDGKVRWTLTMVLVVCWWGFALAVRTRVAYPLQTVSNLLAALREGDFSIRARGAAGLSNRAGFGRGRVAAAVPRA